MHELMEWDFDGRAVRTQFDENGDPWWVAKDVCDVLGVTNITETLKRVDDEDFSITEVLDSVGKLRKTYIVNESGLYSLILTSRKPEAKRFKRWVTSEVLPSIRKTGSYGKPKELTRLQLIDMAREAEIGRLEEQRLRLAAEEETKRLLPAATFGEELMDSATLLTVTAVAKALPHPMTASALHKFLHEKRVIYKPDGAKAWYPYAKYLPLGYFKIITDTGTSRIHNSDGSVEDHTWSSDRLKVTSSGREFIHGLVRQHFALEPTQ